MPVREGCGRCQVWLTAYLAAEAEAQGQEAEEVLAPSDHAGEAPAQSSHIDPQGGRLGERVGEGRAAPGAELGRGWGVWRKARALPRGVPDPQRHRSSPSVLPPLAGGARPKSRNAAPKRLHLPGSPCGRRLHSPGLPPLRPLSSPRRDSLLACLLPRQDGGRAQAPRNFGGSGAAQERRVPPGQRRCQAPGVHLRGRRSSGSSLGGGRGSIVLQAAVSV